KEDNEKSQEEKIRNQWDEIRRYGDYRSKKIESKNKDFIPEDVDRFEYLIEEIKSVKPNVICCLGGTALTAVLKRSGITKLKNNVFQSDEFCRFCGAIFETKERVVQEVDGKLIELDRKAQQKLKRRQDGQAQTFKELVELGKARGYKHYYGWARHKMNARGVRV
ncbi:hypothetical protein LCGC14_1870750, partial [marine sediment metagenome]